MCAARTTRDVIMSFSPRFVETWDGGSRITFPRLEDFHEHFEANAMAMPALGRHWGCVSFRTRQVRRRLCQYALLGDILTQRMRDIEQVLDVAVAALGKHLDREWWRDVFVAALLQVSVLASDRARVLRLCEVVKPVMATPPTSKHEAWIRIVGSCALPGFVSRRVAAEEFLALPGGHHESYPTPTTLKTFAGDDGPAFERALRSGVKRYFAFAEKSKAVDVDASTGRKVIYLDKMYANFPWPWPEAVLAKLYHISTGFMPRIESIWWPTSLMHRS